VNGPAQSHLSEELLNRLRHTIEHVGHLLPAQGPITAFVFLNPLQGLEDVPYDEGVQRGARLFGCQPYLSEERYREKMARRRIRVDDLLASVRKDLGDQANTLVCPLGTRLDVRLAMLQYPLQFGPSDELRWFVAEMDALKSLRKEVPPATRERFVDETRHWVMRDLRNARSKGAHPPGTESEPSWKRSLKDLVQRFGESSIERWSEQKWEAFSLQALWRICYHGVQGIEASSPRSKPPQPLRHRDVLKEATGEDTDALVHDVLIRFCAAFVDQGFAHWKLPYRELGFFKAFCELWRQPGGPPSPWLRDLPRELTRVLESGQGALESVRESLDMLGVSECEWEDFISATLVALRGWAGLIWQLEVRGDRVALPAPQGSLTEFLAIRLLLERVALSHVARQSLNYTGPLAGLRDAARARIVNRNEPSLDQRAFLVFQLAQLLGWSPPALSGLSKADWTAITSEVEAFDSLERRRMFHHAFERRFRIQTLDALSIHTKRKASRVPSPRFQLVSCIDTREVGFRRHLEEVCPEVETFGTAGFFNVPIYYRGAGDAHFSTLCPIVIRPKHWLVEDVVYTLNEQSRARAKTRRALGTASHQVHVGSRSMAQGAILTAGLGILASIPLVARVLFPRLAGQIRRTASRFVAPPPMTRLRLERTSPTAGPEEGQIGFTVEEMANFGERALRDIGLIDDFARLVMFIGHGSFCLNNPHKSAYDCGACSGGAGGPNARALAAILNDLRVREILADRGLRIPSDTIFLGGLHNTCAEYFTFYDLDLLPQSHFQDFHEAEEALEKACERNAHERCRRFDSAPLNLSFAAALRHVEERSEDLAQARPEFGNATNAICIVGRRERTRGLYLDRRAFMQSYDPTQDDAECSILARILGAVVPVCSGINLQYNFSYIDSPGWGAGTKLPHNITSLLGVMDGAASDLRTGLPWQGVEIHEPVRLLFVIETTPQAILSIMDRNPVVGRILRNGWAQLALLNPNSSEILVYRKGEFMVHWPEKTELPKAATSTDWYRGWREHLGFAQIGE
jgi:hypothetical protein